MEKTTHVRYSFRLLFLATFLPTTLWAQSAVNHEALRRANAVVEEGKTIVTAFKAIRYYYNDTSLFDTIRVYRKLCQDFLFNTDYEEYFTHLNYRDAEIIFEGALVPDLDSKFRYVDDTGKKDSVYAYWIGTGMKAPIGPLPIKIRDESVWWPYRKVIAEIHNLKERFPHSVTVDTIGYSVKRTPILGVKVGAGKPTIGLVGAVHPGESGPEIIMGTLAELLEKHAYLLADRALIVIPSISPDQRDRLVGGVPWYLRKNKNEVDLNRNFTVDWKQASTDYNYRTTDPDGLTYRGPFAGSEPETAAVSAFFKQHTPEVLFSFHHLASIAGETLLTARSAEDDSTFVSLSNQIARRYWRGMGVKGAEQMKVAFKCSNGSLPTWCYRELGIPAFDVEGPIDPIDSKRSQTDQTDPILLRKYQQKHLNGLLMLLTQGVIE